VARTIEEKFELLELLGEGAAGTVHRARLRDSGEEVALKVLHGVEVGIPQTRERFAQEARLLMTVRSPYVVRAVTAGAVEGRMYLAMEFVKRARDLGQWTREESPAPARAREVAAGIAEGLAAVHEAGVVHRDLKPANVLVGVDDVPRLADFGLAKSQAGGVRTATGLVLGTPGYMAPEVLRGKPPSPAADVYALGGTLYYLLTARPLFGQEDLRDLLDAQLAGASEVALGALAPEDAGLVRWLTAPEPGSRPGAGEAAEGLRRGRAPAAARTIAAPVLVADDAATQVLSAGPSPVAAPPAPDPPGPPGTWARPLGAALVAALLLGGFAWSGRSTGADSDAPSPAPPNAPPDAPPAESMASWARKVLGLSRLFPLTLLEGAAQEAFSAGGGGVDADTEDVVDAVTKALLALPNEEGVAARLRYRDAVSNLGRNSGWRRLLAAAPPPGDWWRQVGTPEDRQVRRDLASRLQAIWPLEATLETLDAPFPEALTKARAALAPVLRREPDPRLGKVTAGPPLQDIAGRCWAFFARELKGLGGLINMVGSPTPRGECAAWNDKRTGFTTVVRGQDLVTVDRDKFLKAPASAVAVPGGNWVEVTVGFYDVHPTAALVVRLEDEEPDEEAEGRPRSFLDLPFHLPDAARARSLFLPPSLDLGVIRDGPSGKEMVRQTYWIHRDLLPDRVRLRVWVQPLATELRLLRQMTLTAETARGCLVALTWRGVEAPPPLPEG
jgi:serine/threonine protein kinase